MSPAVMAVAVGTRASALARWQTHSVIAQLQAAWPDLTFEERLYTTAGDQAPDRPLTEIGGAGVFTTELENALRAGEIDLAVHSLKDLPIEPAPGLALGAIGQRADARDVLVARDGWTLQTLPQGARLGTCSLRRSAQALAARPDLVIVPLRGNVDTRIRKAHAGEYDAIVLAAAGILRLGREAAISEYLPYEVMLPAPGQGALAMQCRADDERVLALLAPLDHAPTRRAVEAEREFLQGMGGGCSAPVAAYGRLAGDGDLHLSGLVADAEGKRVVRVAGHGGEPQPLGRRLAHEALALGAAELLP
jgi:hydroxymethylbilane synthase